MVDFSATAPSVHQLICGLLPWLELDPDDASVCLSPHTMSCMGYSDNLSSDSSDGDGSNSDACSDPLSSRNACDSGLGLETSQELTAVISPDVPIPNTPLADLSQFWLDWRCLYSFCLIHSGDFCPDLAHVPRYPLSALQPDINSPGVYSISSTTLKIWDEKVKSWSILAPIPDSPDELELPMKSHYFCLF